MLRLKHYRELAKLTQNELAEKCGLSQEYISDLEKEKRTKSPSVDELNIIAKALGICFHDLVDSCVNCTYEICRCEFPLYKK